ncbi:MAG: hypothetical protein AB2L12_02820 [Smithellaceae bacterium]
MEDIDQDFDHDQKGKDKFAAKVFICLLFIRQKHQENQVVNYHLLCKDLKSWQLWKMIAGLAKITCWSCTFSGRFLNNDRRRLQSFQKSVQGGP